MKDDGNELVFFVVMVACFVLGMFTEDWGLTKVFNECEEYKAKYTDIQFKYDIDSNNCYYFDDGLWKDTDGLLK